MLAIWTQCRSTHGAHGDFLFGNFTIADAFYAPVVLRFRTYGVALEGSGRAHSETILNLPALQEWIAEAKTESERIEKFEP